MSADDRHSGDCPKCGSRIMLTTDRRIAAHKAPRGRNYCTGGGGIPRKGSTTYTERS